MKLLSILLLWVLSINPFCCCRKKSIITHDKSTQTEHLVRRVAFIIKEQEELRRESVDRMPQSTPENSFNNLYMPAFGAASISNKK